MKKNCLINTCFKCAFFVLDGCHKDDDSPDCNHNSQFRPIEKFDNNLNSIQYVNKNFINPDAPTIIHLKRMIALDIKNASGQGNHLTPAFKVFQAGLDGDKDKAMKYAQKFVKDSSHTKNQTEQALRAMFSSWLKQEFASMDKNK
jgi:hypothetical protein